MPVVKTAIYARISKDGTGEGLGVERQEASARQIAAARGWEVDEEWVLIENDTSASKRARRPQFERLVRAMETGVVQAVIAYRLDRLVRRLDDTVRLIDIAERHGVLITTVSGDLDLTTAQGRGQTALLGVVTNMEAEATSERIRYRNRQARATGKVVNGGSRPYGWMKDRVHQRPSEAKVVRDIAEWLIRGESVTGVARRLNAEGVKTAGGRRWDVKKIKDVISNVRHAAYQGYGNEIVYDGDGLPIMLAGVEPILAPDVWDEAMQALAARSVTTDRWTGVRGHLLSGTLTRCGVCGEKVFPHAQSNGKTSYRCRGHASRDRDRTDEYVLQQVREFALANPIRVGAWSMEERVDLSNEITTVENQVWDLEEKFLANGGDAARLARMTARLEEKAARLRTQQVDRLAQQQNHALMSHEYAQLDLSTLLESSASLLPNGDHEEGMNAAQKSKADRQKQAKADAIREQRAAIRMFASSIVIHPSNVRGRRFDYDSIDIRWRDPESIRWSGTIESQ